MKIERMQKDHPLWDSICAIFPEAIKWLNKPEDTGNYHFLGAINDNGMLVGGSVLDIGEMGFGPLKKMVVGFLEDIEIICEYRNQGIGYQLLKKTLDYAWAKGCQNIRWQVDYDNAAGIALYQKLGCAFIPEEDPDAEEPIRQYTVVAVKK